MDICADNCLSGMSQSDISRLYRRIRRKLGEPVVGVELRDEQLEECVCEAIEEYSSFINNWALENRMSQMLGLPKNIDFTLKYVSNNFGFERTFARAYGDLAGTSSTSLRELKVGIITLTAGTQNYFIEENREINEIMWYTPSFINLYGLDPLSNSNIAYTEFGASFAGYNLYSVMPVFDTILTAQAATVRNKVRGSEYSYRVIGGPNGTKRLTLYPVPRMPADSGAYISPGFATPGSVLYYYYDTIGIGGNGDLSGFTANPGYTGDTDSLGNPTQGNGLVSGPSDAQLYDLSYNELNDPAKRWIKRFAQGMAKELLGIGIRGKFSGVIPIPGAEVTLNADSLITNGKADMDALREELSTTLEKLNYKAILENNASIQESINKTFIYSPMGIWRG
jgi:hypothetical protein